MQLTCPFCGNSFDSMDMLFYADTQNNTFMFSTDAARNVASTAPINVVRQATDMSSVRAGARGLVRTKAEEEAAKKQAEEEAVKAFPLGDQCDDYVARDFFKPYGEGVSFRFQRTATFYGIKDADYFAEEHEDSKEYGYVESWEDREGQIPLTLNVPSRPFNKKNLTKRICPKCHCDIPTKYFITDEDHKHYATLAGCTSAGKTQFMTVALRELNISLSLLGLGDMTWTECSQWFNQMYVEKYKNTKGMSEATNTSIAIFPLMFSVVDRERRERHFITIYDCAGESAQNADYAANLPGFRRADTMLLMIDSKQFFRDLARDLKEDICELDYTLALRTVSEFGLCPNVRRIFTVITKCDAILGLPNLIHGDTDNGFADGMLSYEYDMNCHRNRVNLSAMSRIDQELRTMLEYNGFENVADIIKNNIQNNQEIQVNLMAVSTYVHKGNRLVCDIDQETGHHRLIEPLLYAMIYWNVLPYKDEPIPSPETPTYYTVGEETAPMESVNGFQGSSVTSGDGDSGKNKGFFHRIFGKS